MPKERFSHGDAVHRRRVLARGRQDVVDINRRITEQINARDRLTKIETLLSDPIPSVTDPLERLEQKQNRAGWEIEQIWLKFKLGIITQAEQQYDLSKKFDDLEKGMPGVYDWLTKTDHGLSIAQQIREKWFPQIRIGGYHTRR